MKTYKLVWTGAAAALEAASTLLMETLGTPAGAVSLTRPDDAAADDAVAWRLDAYFAETPDLNAIREALAEVGGLSAPTLETLPDIDWVAHALAGLGVVRAGRFVLYGAHDADKLPDEPGDIAIRIDANEAFGTGHNATTSGCLEAIDALTRRRRFARVLDLGCGTGVLAIAAARALPGAKLVASDIDPLATAVARGNVRHNAIGVGRLAVVTADAMSHRSLRAGRFDLIVANILANPLIVLAGRLARTSPRCGILILSGLLVGQAPEVLAAYRAAGFSLLHHRRIAGWSTLTLVRC